ncbi:MAG: [Clostridia bacterium]|nr:[FeFe] hydrogenase H-cluster maturation GTPase HydF [Clostridia bacterium]
MEQTPISMRKHIALVGDTNSGKSTLFNRLLGQDISIVSDVSGTTTDSVIKAMELIPYGPVALMDTAGLSDESELGKQRMDKTLKTLDRADLILYILDAAAHEASAIYFSKPAVIVFNKCELLDEDTLLWLKKENQNAVFLSNFGNDGLEALKARMVEELKKLDAPVEEEKKEEETWVGDLLPEKSTVVLVTPIDSAAPKGRLILPQVQILRDCLDHNMKVMVTKETELKEVLDELKKVDLVITDSQIFPMVDEIVPKEIPLTSFSMLLARKKGDFAQYLEGVSHFANLKDGDAILVLEGCTHNTTHEDIARRKLPVLVHNKLGVGCRFFYFSGYDFPDDLSEYKMALSCGMCMINKQEVETRMKRLKEANIPVSNYGVAIAYLNGILDRATEIFK